MAATVLITAPAQDEFTALPRTIQPRVATVFERLADWPRGEWGQAVAGRPQGQFPNRTGDYRVIFRVSADGGTVTVWKIGYRGDIYD